MTSHKGDNFVTSCIAICNQDHSEKGSTLKGRNLLPKGPISILLTHCSQETVKG